MLPCLYGGRVAAQEMIVVSDRDGAPPADVSAPAESPRSTNGAQEKNSGTTEDPKLRLVKLKEEGIRRVAQAVQEEEQLALNAVRALDNEAARQWLAGFISCQPLNCPLRGQGDWIQAIIQAVERNGLPVCKEILGLVASIISIESGFHSDPLCVDPSRGHTMTGLLDRAEKDLYEKHGTVMSVPPVPQLYKRYKDKYYAQLLECRTEGQVEVVARGMADDLRKDSARLPAIVRGVVDKEIGKLTNVVRTKGSMQLNFVRAKQVMGDRGEEFTDQELLDYMYTLHGGVDVGVAALKPMFVQYAARYATPDSLSWLFFVGMDYHYGPFSSRNMMEQIRIRDLTGRKIALDGDFLHYEEDGRPQDKNSETLQAVRSVLPETSGEAILSALVLEKDPHYIYTEIHEAIATAHRRRFGETPFAVIGELWMGNNAQLKHGLAWKTSAYLNKLDRYLNAIPWDE